MFPNEIYRFTTFGSINGLLATIAQPKTSAPFFLLQQVFYHAQAMEDFAPFERIKILFQLSDKPKSLVDFLIGCGFYIFSKPQPSQVFR